MPLKLAIAQIEISADVRKNGRVLRRFMAKAATPEQQARIGDQTGGHVLLFLHTDDFERDYQSMRTKGVHFTEQPRHEEYGTVVVFTDPFGNKWDLVQPSTARSH